MSISYSFKKDDPQVSVVLAVKNEQEFIRAALGSICAQEGVNFEVIVVDDNSGDETSGIVVEMMENLPHLSLFTNPRKGKVAAFNTGVDMARGHFVCLFAGDDIMPPGSLAARWDLVKRFPVNESVCGLYKIKTLSDDPKLDGQVVPRAKGKGNMSGQSPLMTRALVNRIFPVPEGLPNEDTWMDAALRYLPNTVILHSDVICCYWRIHERNTYNMTMNFNDYKARIVSRLHAYQLFYEKFLSELTNEARQSLINKIEFDRHYTRGSVLGVLCSSVSMVEKLRFLASINPLLYNIRKRFFKLFSGW